MLALWKKSYDQPRQHIKKQRHNFTDKGASSQSYSFSSSHVWIWELSHKESWALKNWCFETVVWEKTLESPLDCKEIQPVHPKGNQSWIVMEGLMLKLKLQLWPPDAKSWLIWKDPDAGKDWRREEKGKTEDEMVGWRHRLDGCESAQTPGDNEGQRSPACCSPRGCQGSDTTERLTHSTKGDDRHLGQAADPPWYRVIDMLIISMLSIERFAIKRGKWWKKFSYVEVWESDSGLYMI